VARLHLPMGEQQVMCQRLDMATLASLGQLDHLREEVSPSVAWFASLYGVAAHMVSNGRVVPQLDRLDDHRWQARWVPLRSDADAAVAALAPVMPPVVAAGGDDMHLTGPILDAFVDQLARVLLTTYAWRPDVVDTRRVAAKAMRSIGRALSLPGSGTASGEIRSDAETVEAFEMIAAWFDRLRRRGNGEPIVAARLRLGLPDTPAIDGEAPLEGLFADDAFDDAFDDGGSPAPGLWPLALEIVDLDDRSRWCTEADVELGTPLAAEVARDSAMLPKLLELLQFARDSIEATAPWLAEWLQQPVLRGRRSGISLDAAAATLEAVEALAAVGVEVVAPERLTKRRTSSRATASPGDGSSGRFTASAIVHWETIIDDTPIDEAALQRAAESGANLIQVGGRWVQLDRTEARRALANLAQHRAQHSELSGLELLQLSAELQAEQAARALADGISAIDDDAITPTIGGTGWVGELLAGLPDTTLADGVVPATFTATLRPYQLRGLGWLQFLHRIGFGGCLADDMGLGKTPTTLAHLAALPGPHLVVCPLSVVRNWQNETAKFAPFMRVAVHHGTGRVDAARFGNLVAQHDIVISTYQVAARDIDSIKQISWETAVFDEAQAMKNPETGTAKAMRQIPARQRIALTGTPVENRLSEMWSIFNTVVPGLLGSLPKFRTRFATPIEKNRDAAAAAGLRQLTGPFLLRRTKADRSLVPDLPDKVEQVAWAPLTREQASMYQAVVDQLLLDAQQSTGMRRRGLVLAALTRLKQICNHPAHALGDGSKLAGRSGKLQRFDELVTDLLDAGEQALVFTQFREMGLLLQQHLHERFDQRAPFLHGGVSKQGRDAMVAAFQTGSAPSPLLLVSLKAGGTGLNLTAASTVVHYDRWWNPAVEDQATDRAWRIGQSRSVFVHKLVCQGTIEEKVDALITDKRALADAVIGTTGEAWLSEMSTDELRDLVVLDMHAARGL
jgi:superfamily II DNA or RNA helicase